MTGMDNRLKAGQNEFEPRVGSTGLVELSLNLRKRCAKNNRKSLTGILHTRRRDARGVPKCSPSRYRIPAS